MPSLGWGRGVGEAVACGPEGIARFELTGIRGTPTPSIFQGGIPGLSLVIVFANIGHGSVNATVRNEASRTAMRATNTVAVVAAFLR